MQYFSNAICMSNILEITPSHPSQNLAKKKRKRKARIFNLTRSWLISQCKNHLKFERNPCNRCKDNWSRNDTDVDAEQRTKLVTFHKTCDFWHP